MGDKVHIEITANSVNITFMIPRNRDALERLEAFYLRYGEPLPAGATPQERAAHLADLIWYRAFHTIVHKERLDLVAAEVDSSDMDNVEVPSEPTP